jgi:hypothetical protein
VITLVKYNAAMTMAITMRMMRSVLPMFFFILNNFKQGRMLQINKKWLLLLYFRNEYWLALRLLKYVYIYSLFNRNELLNILVTITSLSTLNITPWRNLISC